MEPLILDKNFRAVSVVDSFKSLIWTDRYNAYGDFELYLPMRKELLPAFKSDYYLWCRDSEHSMIIEELSIDSDIEDGSFITVTGRSLESILERRIVWGQKSLNGSLQDAIESLLNESVISPAISDRKIDNFIFSRSSDPRITALTVDTQVTGINLYLVIQTLCNKSGLGFKVILNQDNQFVFSLYAGADRSYKQADNPYVIFSPRFDNIISSNYFTSKQGLKNVTLVAGEGEGASRKMITVGSGTALERRELFTDARDISSDTDNGTLSAEEYNAKLTARGNEDLMEYIERTAFEGEVEATNLFVYGKDFFMGDIVQIENEFGHEGTAYISELVMAQDENGASVYPTFQMT